MTPVEKFWVGCLKAGGQLGNQQKYNGGFSYEIDAGWQTGVRASVLYDHYVARSQQAGVTRRAMEMELADALMRMMPGVTHARISINGHPSWGWKFPPLKECRTAFDKYMNWTYPWPDDLDDLKEEVVSSECTF